jgi:hypothetical protein
MRLKDTNFPKTVEQVKRLDASQQMISTDTETGSVGMADPNDVPEDSVVICVTPDKVSAEFQDGHNVEALCFECGVTVVHRDYIPAKLRKICFECVVKAMQEGEDL